MAEAKNQKAAGSGQLAENKDRKATGSRQEAEGLRGWGVARAESRRVGEMEKR
jgi:hypothetical protein